jgi:hypothetical protein
MLDRMGRQEKGREPKEEIFTANGTEKGSGNIQEKVSESHTKKAENISTQ